MGQPPLEVSRVVDASPEAVWRVVADLRSMGRRSPETVAMWISREPRVGSRGVNLNRRRWFVWPTTTRVTRWEPGRALAFHVWPTNCEWSYELTPEGSGTRVVERRSEVRSGLVVRLVAKHVLGGEASHDTELEAGMHATLDAVARAT